jgi:hypothetical protein
MPTEFFLHFQQSVEVTWRQVCTVWQVWQGGELQLLSGLRDCSQGVVRPSIIMLQKNVLLLLPNSS